MKTKLTFVYDNGKTFTTSRNVTWTFDQEDQFIYETSYKDSNGIYREDRFYINKSDLLAVIFHRDEDDTVQLKLFRKNVGYGVSLNFNRVDEEHGEVIEIFNFGTRSNLSHTEF